MDRRLFLGGVLVTAVSSSIAQATPVTDRIKIGVLFALSGPAAFLGESQEKAFKMLVEEKNAQGGLAGRKIEYVLYDTEGNGTKAIQQLRRLVDSDRVDVVFGPNTSAEALLIKPVAAELKTPVLSFSGAVEMTVPPSPWIFQAVPNNRVAVQHFLGFLKKKNFKKIAFIASTDSFGQGGATLFKQLAPDYGLTIIAAEEFGLRDTDMTPQVLKIKGLSPDAMVIWSINPGPSIILRNAKAIGFDKAIFNSNGVASPQFIDQVGAAGEGTWLSAPRLLSPDSLPDSDPSKSVVSKLYQTYVAKWKKQPAAFAAIPHDALLVLESALGSVKDAITRKNLRDAIESVSGVVGANGIYTFSSQNHMGLDDSSHPMVMMRIVNGKFVVEP